MATPDAAPLFAAALSPQHSHRRSTLVAAAPSPQIMAGGFLTYAATSTALLTAVVYEAVQQRRQFYPTVIYLTTSKVSALVLGNEALVLTLLFGQLCKRFFFGRLREAEVEHLYERSWFAITETCLAMTIFREEFNVRFVALFTALLFLKIFHWLLQDRVAFMEQTPAVRLFTHARMLLLMATLFALDAAFLYHAVSVSLLRGPSVLLLFAFEYLILASTVCATFSKYALHINDMRLGGRWDEKGVYLFYLELVTDLFHMLVYLAFFVLICTYYGGTRAPPEPPAPGKTRPRPRLSARPLLPHYSAAAHHARPLPHVPLVPHPRRRLHPVPPHHAQHARALPRRHRGGSRAHRSHLHHLPRADDRGEEAGVRPLLPLPLPPVVA